MKYSNTDKLDYADGSQNGGDFQVEGKDTIWEGAERLRGAKHSTSGSASTHKNSLD